MSPAILRQWSWRAPPDIAWIEPRFAIGSRPDPNQRAPVRQLGVDTVIALHEPNPGETEAWATLDVEFLAFPTEDWVEIPVERFTTVVDAVLSRQRVGRTVLLHCVAGVNRAPTFAVAVLCRSYGLSVEEALRRVYAVRSAIAPTEAQIASLRAWLRWAGHSASMPL